MDEWMHSVDAVIDMYTDWYYLILHIVMIYFGCLFGSLLFV